MEMESGAATDEVSPFWRVIEAGSTIAKKIDIDGAWIENQRETEAADTKKATKKAL